MTARRKFFFVGGAGLYLLLAPIVSLAQQKGKVWRIGFFYFGSRQSAIDTGRYGAFLQGMRELAYEEGRNLVVEARFAASDPARVDRLAAELVELKPDVIVATGSPTYLALRRATTTIPIVVTVSADPLADGLAASLAHPGGNVTGLSDSGAEVVAKYLELLSSVAPKPASVGVLVNPSNGTHPGQLKLVASAAEKLRIQVTRALAGTEQDIERGYSAFANARAGAAIALNDTFFAQQIRQIAALAIKHHMASIYSIQDYAEVGGLMSYGPDIVSNFRRSATYVDKILKGAKPADLPIEQPTRFYLILNRKTASALKVSFSQELLLRADRVIE